ncbi:unnamed protein product [Jaminaea pallidilutea]
MRRTEQNSAASSPEQVLQGAVVEPDHEAQEQDDYAPSPSASKGKGLARLPFVRKLVGSLIDSAILELSHLDVKRPESNEGLTVGVRLKVSGAGSKPLPLKAKIKFKGPATLCWPAGGDVSSRGAFPSKKGKHTRAGQVIARAKLDDLRLSPASASTSAGVTSLSLERRDDASRVGPFVRALIQAPVDEPFSVVVQASDITVKAYGFSFAGLSMQKEVKLSGLGNLGGALRFPLESRDANSTTHASDKESGAVTDLKRKSGFLSRGSSSKDKSAAGTSTSHGGSLPVASTLTAHEIEIIGGDPERGIIISTAVDISIGQPSKTLPPIRVQSGELRFNLSLPAGPERYVAVGQLVLADTLLEPGVNRFQATGSIRIPDNLDPASAEGRACSGLFTNLLQDEPVALVALAQGPASSSEDGAGPVSDAPWLASAFAGAQIWATLPPLGDKARLLDGAQLKAENELSIVGAAPPLDRQRSSSVSSVGSYEPEQTFVRTTIRNSFAAPILIRQLTARAVEEVVNLPATGADRMALAELGHVVVPQDWKGVEIGPNESMPITLPFELNDDPRVLIRILRASARQEGVELGTSFNKVLDLAEQGAPDHKAAQQTSDDTPQDFARLLTEALANLRVCVDIDIHNISIGDYSVPNGIQFTQRALAITVSKSTASWIVPRVGGPVVGQLVESGKIEIGSLDVREINESGMSATASLILSDFGPIAAEVSLDGGIALRWPNDHPEPERRGQIAAMLLVKDPLRIDPLKARTAKRDVQVAPGRGASRMDNFARFVGALLSQKETHWMMEAVNIRVTAGNTDFFPRLSKTITLQGFGGFPELTADSFDIVGEDILPPTVAARLDRRKSDNECLSFRAAISLPNESIISLQLARLEADLLVQDTVIGQLTVTDLGLYHGQTTRTKATGFVFGADNAQILGDVASDLLANKSVKLQVRGRSALVAANSSSSGSAPSSNSVDRRAKRKYSTASRTSSASREDIHPVEWLDAALRHLRTNAVIRQDLHDVVQRVELDSLHASFPRGKDPNIEVGGLLVKYQVPFPIDVKIEEVSAEVEILLDNAVVGKGLATKSQVLEADEKAGSRRRTDSRSDSEVEYASGTVKMSLSEFQVKTHSDAFPKMITHVFDCEESDRISLLGVAHVKVRTALGVLPVHVDLGEAHKLRIRGMRSLRTSPTDYTNLQVVGATRERLKVNFDLYLNNPSKNVMFTLPDTGLSFAAFYRGAFVGRAYVGGDSGPFSLTSGPCAFKNVHFMYYPSEDEEEDVRQLPANFLSGKVTPLEIRGDDESTDLPALRPALSSLRLAFDLRPLVDRTLIASIEITLGAKVLTANSVECEFGISNPLKVPIDLTSLSFTANYKGKPFGTSSMNWPEGKALRVEPGSGPEGPGQASGQCLVRLGQRLDQLVKAFLKERGQIFLQVDLKAGVEMGGYRIPVFEYTQERLPLHIRNLQGVSKLLWALPG